MQKEPQDTIDARLESLLGHVRGDARQQADALVRRILAISDRTLRKPVLREVLSALDDPLLVAVLNDLLTRSREGNSRCRELVQELALEPGLIAHMPYERVQRLYALATRHELLDIRGLFLSTRKKGRDESHTENDHLQLPLGVRKQAARTSDRFLLDRLLRDRNVDVIRNLLRNPRLVEQDILLIVSTRPTRPEILETVAQHPRWSSRYTVRKALACNPYTPSAIALNLLATLMLQDLKFLLGSGVMAPEVHAEAERLVALRNAERKQAVVLVDASDVHDLVEDWQDSAEAGVVDEVGEVAFHMPTSEAVIDAHRKAEQAARDKVLQSLEYPDPNLRAEYLDEKHEIQLVEDQASAGELSEGVDQLIKDWLILDPSISAEMVAMAEFTEVEALAPDAAPKVGWPGAEEADITPAMLALQPASAAPRPKAPVDETALEVARLLHGWKKRDGEISDDFLASADDLVIEAFKVDEGE